MRSISQGTFKQLRLLGLMGTSAAILAVGLGSCREEPTAVAPVLAISFSQTDVDLGNGRSSTVEIQNTGNRAVGPVELLASSVRDLGGNVVPGSSVSITPTTIATLNAGQSATITVDVTVGALVQSGQYRGDITARAGADATASVTLTFAVATEPIVEISALTITSTTASVRQGDVVQFDAETLDPAGDVITGLPVQWSVSPPGNAFVDGAGRLVGYVTGSLTLTAAYGGLSDALTVAVTPRGLSGSATTIGAGVVTDRYTSDLWIHGNYAYTGTWGQRTLGGTVSLGDQLHVWDISSPTNPVRTSTLSVEARTVNDVKVRSDGTLGILTHEASTDGLNGVTVLDLTDPAQPTVASRFTTGLENGVHNAWLEGDYAYLAVDGTGSGLRVLDLSDPSSPTTVASFYAGSSFLHDVYVRDGIAFLAHWDAGLILLDVGNGMAGGSPTNPVEISRIADLGGQTHNAWYWPATGYIFVGEEDFATPGHMRVIDASDLANPRVIGSFAVPGSTPHNFWLDEANAVLYLAWYENGLRAVDVSGVLMGELDRQGREFFGVVYNGVGTGCSSASGTCAWAPQAHQGLVYVSDLNAGLVVLQPSF